MPRFIDTDLRTTEMVIGVNRVLVAHGIPGLTMRMIARESGISTGSLFHHFESRERILRIAAHRTGRTLIHGARSDALWIGIDAHLPGDAETLRLTRSWLAWCELWRSESWLEEAVTDLRADERSALAELHGPGISPTDLDALVALLDGLRAAVCSPVSAMPVEQARGAQGGLVVGAPADGVSQLSSRGGVVAHHGSPGGGRHGWRRGQR
jgi:AcrR family transcriptional regulator